VLTPVVLSLYLGLHDLRGSWDDGAITAAFARTYADTGRLALTPNSPTVEGVSSLVWLLLLSIPERITPNPDLILIIMKCLSAGSLAFALAIIYRIALEQLSGNEKAAFVSVLVIAWSFTSQLEIKNGMEMNLALMLTVLIFYLLTRPYVGARGFALSWLLASLLLAVRFESVAVLFFLVLGLYIDSLKRHDRSFYIGLLLLSAGTLLSFATLEVWRHRVFGLWMPNTAYAKAWQPYSRWHGETSLVGFLTSTALAVIELLPILGIPLLLILVVKATNKKSSESSEKLSAAVWTLSIAAFVITWVIGLDWGYPGRVIAPTLPFVFIAVIAICKENTKAKRLTSFLGALVLAQASIWLYFAMNYARPVITIGQTRDLALGAEMIRSALQQPTLTVMLPDVGGSSLYGESLQIIDSALLTNPELAQKGWGHFATYFHRTQTEVFETHSIWANYQSAYTSDLLNNYSIVAANGTRFFLRNDLYSKLLSGGHGEVRPVDSSPSCLGGPLANDIAYSRVRKVCLLLDAEDKKN
jgi:hypothetical protein